MFKLKLRQQRSDILKDWKQIMWALKFFQITALREFPGHCAVRGRPSRFPMLRRPSSQFEETKMIIGIKEWRGERYTKRKLKGSVEGLVSTLTTVLTDECRWGNYYLKRIRWNSAKCSYRGQKEWLFLPAILENLIIHRPPCGARRRILPQYRE